MASTIEHASVGGADVGGATASLSSLAPTCRVRWRIVSTSGASPSGKNSSSSERARRYGSKAPILARVRSYSGVQRSGMISATGVMVRRDATPHRQGPKRGARTSTAPNNDVSRRGRMSLSGRCAPQRWQRRRLRQCSSVCAWTRWRCSPASVLLPSATVNPSVSAKSTAVLLPAAADLAQLQGTLRCAQFQHDPPLHLALPAQRQQVGPYTPKVGPTGA